VDHYGYRVVLNNIDLPFPRDGDKWLMCVFEELGFTPPELLKLNKVHLHQQVLFLSDILCVKGKKIDPKYKKLRREEENWSNLIFRKKNLLLRTLKFGKMHFGR